MEYNRNFQDNILASEFNTEASRIANWIEENKEQYDWAKDPNAYEMTNVFLFAGKYASEGKAVDLDEVNRMWEMRSGDFERCGIGENHFVFQICKQSYEAAMKGQTLVDDEQSHSALRKMAGVGLYVMQQKREKGIMEYNNTGELINLIEDSKALKQKYPNIHDSLKFEQNIGVLYELQQPHISGEIKQELDNSYRSYEEMQTKTTRDTSNDER